MAKKHKFIQNTLLLTLTSIILRTAGMFFRVYISNILSEEGMGLYQLIFSVYFLGITFATGGLSIAVTRIVSSQIIRGGKRNAANTVKIALILSLVISISIAIIMFINAPFIAKRLIGDLRCALSLKILSISLPFISICATLNGYFVANSKVSFNCVGQIIEQTIRIAFVFVIATAIKSYSVPIILAGVVMANTISEAVSCIFMYFCYLFDKKRLSDDDKILSRFLILKEMLKISVPISLTKYLSTVLHTVENLLVPQKIARYTLSSKTALSQYGALKGMALPLLFFPSSFLTSLSTLLVPEISKANSVFDNKKVCDIVSRAIHITLFLSIMLSGIFFVLARDIGMIVYKSEQVGFIIGVLAPIIPFMYMDSIADGLLKGLNQQVFTLKYSTIDSCIRIILIIFLVPKTGIKGFLFVMILSNILISSLNFSRLIKASSCKFKLFKWILSPVLSIFISSFVSRLFYTPSSFIKNIFICCPIFVITYFLILFLTKSLKISDIKI